MKNILVTGGAGFIGSHLIRLLVNKYPKYNIINMDKLTYAGNLENLRDIENKDNYTFIKCDICSFNKVSQIFSNYNIDSVLHLAAESHVDRSIEDPFSFAKTNVMGTLSLLQAAKDHWKIILMINYFIMFQQMKFMVLWEKMVFLLKPQIMIHIHPTQHLRHLQIIL